MYILLTLGAEIPEQLLKYYENINICRGFEQ
jgi:hypothetical protein